MLPGRDKRGGTFEKENGMNAAERDFYKLAKLRAYDAGRYAGMMEKMAENAGNANDARRKRHAETQRALYAKTPGKFRARSLRYYNAHKAEINARKRANYDSAKAMAKQRAYYAEHRKEILENQRARRIANRSEINAKQRAYYAAHKEAILERLRARRAERRDEINAEKRAHYAEHREEINAKRRAYCAAHRESQREYFRKWRAEHAERARELNRKHDRKRAKDPKRVAWSKAYMARADVKERLRENDRKRNATPERRAYFREKAARMKAAFTPEQMEAFKAKQREYSRKSYLRKKARKEAA